MDSLYDGFDINDAPSQSVAKDSTFTTSDDAENRSMLGTSFNMTDTVRPMTSNKSAGYSSAARSKKRASSGYKGGGGGDGGRQNESGRRARGPGSGRRRGSGGGEGLSPSERAESLEKDVNRLLRESILAAASGELAVALDLAQKCRKLDVEAVAYRRGHGLEEGIKSDLSVAVLLNVAGILEADGLYNEALKVLSSMLHWKGSKMSVRCRVRVKMGNIYYEQQRYESAVKMYRMALDEVGSASWRLKVLISRNVGNALIKMGCLVDAMQSMESMADGARSRPRGQPHGDDGDGDGDGGRRTESECTMMVDAQSLFNLVVAYYTLGDKEKMKKGFLQLLECSAAMTRWMAASGPTAATKSGSDPGSGSGSGSKWTAQSDEYGVFLLRRWMQWSHYMKRSVQLIGRAIAEPFDGDEYSGYDFLIHHLSAMRQRLLSSVSVPGDGGVGGGGGESAVIPDVESQGAEDGVASSAESVSAQQYGAGMVSEIAVQLQVSQGIEYLKDERFADAVSMLFLLQKEGGVGVGVGAESGSQSVRGHHRHHNNLSFLHFVGSEYAESASMAASAVSSDRYNAAALVNRANCLLVFGSAESAKEMYLEAIGVEADCVEAIYNLGVAAKKMGHFKDALAAFKKLHKMDEEYAARMDPQILFQIGHCHHALSQRPAAIEWFKTVQGVLPSDCSLLVDLANLYREGPGRGDKAGPADADPDTLVFHQFLDCYTVYKANLSVLSWLGVWYINHSLYDHAVAVFHVAAQLNPKHTPWRLMIASCRRRQNSFDAAIRIYQHLLDEADTRSAHLDADHGGHAAADLTTKCLQYLAAITAQIDHPQATHYRHRLLLHQQQHRPHHDQQQQPSPTPPPDDDTATATATTSAQHHRQHQGDGQRDRDRNEEEEPDADQWADVQLDDELLPS